MSSSTRTKTEEEAESGRSDTSPDISLPSRVTRSVGHTDSFVASWAKACLWMERGVEEGPRGGMLPARLDTSMTCVYA